MACYVITEEPEGVALLTELLRPDFDLEQGEVSILAGGGESGADALARSILAVRHEPVALVVDADTVEPGRVRESRRFLEYSLGEFGGAGFGVFLAEPSLDSLLFNDRAIIEALTGRRPTDEQMLRGHYEPRRILEELLPNGLRGARLAERLPEIDLSSLRTHPLIEDLRKFITEKVAIAAEGQLAAAA